MRDDRGLNLPHLVRALREDRSCVATLWNVHNWSSFSREPNAVSHFGDPTPYTASTLQATSATVPRW